MRFHRLAVLGIFALLTCSILAKTDSVAGQSTPVDIARGKLVEAFQQVQQADVAGSSPAVISQLSNNLNLALLYEQNAIVLVSTNQTLSGVYASLSFNMSSETTIQALSATSAAQTQTLLGQLGIYSLAVAAAFGSTLLIMQLHRFKDLVRRVTLRRVRLG